MSKFYAQCNQYASTTDHGCANTWMIISFDTAADRDAWVEQDGRLGTQSITHAEARKLAGSYQRKVADNGGHLATRHLLRDSNGGWVPAF